MLKFWNLITSNIAIISTILIASQNAIFMKSPYGLSPLSKANNTWKETNLNDFKVPSHNLSMTICKDDSLQIAINPSQADINLNIYNKGNWKVLYYRLGVALDHKYQKFLYVYGLDEDLFEHTIGESPRLPSQDYTIIDKSTNKTWIPFNDFDPNYGDWASYNLTFKNLLNKTSFDFSLNLTYFNLTDFSPDNSISFGSTNSSPKPFLQWIWDNQPHYFNDIATIDFTEMINTEVNGIKKNVADFGTDAAAAFFLNQIHYHYWFYTYVDWKSYNETYISFTDPDYVINLKNLNPTSKADLEDGVTVPAIKFPSHYSGGGVYATWQWNFSETVLDNDVDPLSLTDQSAFYYPKYWNTISQQDIGVAFDSSDGTKIYIDNLAMTGSDYMPSYYRFDYRTAGWPASSSFNTTVFDNKAYVLPSNYPNPAQSIINKLTNFNFSYPSVLNPNISSPSAQESLLTQLDSVNNDVLKPYLSDASAIIHDQFTLDSGSDNLVAGNNPATFTINYPNYPQWTAQVDVNILYQS